MNRASPEQRRGKGGRAAVLGLASVCLAVAAGCWWCLVPVRYTFDATTARTPAELGWAAPGSSVGPSNFELKIAARRRTATVKLPALQPYEEPRVARMFCEAPRGSLQKLVIAGAPLTMEQAVDRVRDWSRVWGFDTPDMGQWRTRVGNGDLGPYAAGRFAKTPGAMDVWLEIRPSFNRDRPWYVTFNVYWHPAAGG